jgi:hypothetical protein
MSAMGRQLARLETSDSDRAGPALGDDLQWGRSMLARLGGLAVQKRYLLEGRTGEKHPARKAARVSAQHRRVRKEQREQEKRREAIGLPPITRHKVLPCC